MASALGFRGREESLRGDNVSVWRLLAVVSAAALTAASQPARRRRYLNLVVGQPRRGEDGHKSGHRLWVERLRRGLPGQYWELVDDWCRRHRRPRPWHDARYEPGDRLWCGGFGIVFQANTGNLWITGAPGTRDLGLGMMRGTSPAIAGGSTWKFVFQANTGHLWAVGAGGTGDLGLGTAGSSPTAA